MATNSPFLEEHTSRGKQMHKHFRASFFLGSNRLLLFPRPISYYGPAL